MGHAINFNVFSVKESKEKIFDMVNEVAIEEGDYHSGLNKAIRWYDDKCFNSYEDAEAFINKKDDGWYDQLAVKFKEDKKFKPSKVLEKLQERVLAEQEKYNALSYKSHFKNHSSALITCKNCTSKIATKYLKHTNYCPVCSSDLRPVSTLDKIRNAKNKLDKLCEQRNERERAERSKNIDKAETFWLVKTEYHV